MASSSSLLLCLGLCGLLAHVPHAMRQSSSEDVMDDSMVCECKEVKSVKDCPDYNIKKNGFPPGFPHYYHEKVQSGTRYANLCCRMAPNEKKSRWSKLTSSFVVQKNKDSHVMAMVFHGDEFCKRFSHEDDYVTMQLRRPMGAKDRCLEETRPLENGCCSLAGSTQIYGGDFQLFLSSAKVYSMAHKKMLPSGNPTWKEYEKKSNAFIEIEGISGAKTAAGKTIQASQLRSEMEGIKKLINGGDLQCKEDFAGVAASNGACKIPLAEPVCCCKTKNLDMGPTVCLEMPCAPKENPLHLAATGLNKENNGLYVRGYTPIWPDPFAECPTQEGVSFVKARRQLSKYTCTHTQKKAIGATFHVHGGKKTQNVCVAGKFDLPCPAGKVKYEVVKGWHVEGHEFSCPAGFKSNLPGDLEKDSRCHCNFP